jgi:hypothetical protein
MGVVVDAIFDLGLACNFWAMFTPKTMLLLFMFLEICGPSILFTAKSAHQVVADRCILA